MITVRWGLTCHGHCTDDEVYPVRVLVGACPQQDPHRARKQVDKGHDSTDLPTHTHTQHDMHPAFLPVMYVKHSDITKKTTSNVTSGDCSNTLNSQQQVNEKSNLMAESVCVCEC